MNRQPSSSSTTNLSQQQQDYQYLSSYNQQSYAAPNYYASYHAQCEQHYYQNYPYTYYHQQQLYPPSSIYPPGVATRHDSITHLQNFGSNSNDGTFVNGYFSQDVSEQQGNTNLAATSAFDGSTAIASLPTSLQPGMDLKGRCWGVQSPYSLAAVLPCSQHEIHLPPRTSQALYSGRGRRGSWSFRGRGRGHGVRGLGDRGLVVSTGVSSAQGGGPQASSSNAAPVWPPPRMAWCELCRVDCNTSEILEQHKNGKKHKKKLQEYERMQNLNQVIAGMQRQQVPVSQPTEVVQPDAVAETLEGENTLDEVGKRPASDASEVQIDGSKRSMSGGGGGKRMRIDRSRRPLEPPKPKQVIPLVCELCNVKCDTQAVFDSHLAGKKHLKKFQGYQAILGAVVLQALHQTSANLPSSSLLPQANQQAIDNLQRLLSQPNPDTLPPNQNDLLLQFAPAIPAVSTQNPIDVVSEPEAAQVMENDTKTEPLQTMDANDDVKTRLSLATVADVETENTESHNGL